MKENKKDSMSFNETEELSMLSNDNVCEIIQMAINDIEDLYNELDILENQEDNDAMQDYRNDLYSSDPYDAEFDKYFMPLFDHVDTKNRVLIH